MKFFSKRALWFFIAAALIGVVLGITVKPMRLARWFYKPTATTLPRGITATGGQNETASGAKSATTTLNIVADNLRIPWEIAFLPNEDMLVTERSGTLRRVGKDGRVYTIAGVAHVGEGGLLGLVLHPKFSENQWLYLYLTTREINGLRNRVERYWLQGDEITERKVILENIPGAANHDGGRLAFGPDGLLYITTGDAEKSNYAQDKNSLAGKILRVTDEGAIPPENPFGTAVYSYGHRNPQGLAWDTDGRLWATEHGRSGALSGLDEFNLIEIGKNYGWPVIQGDEEKPSMETPVVNSGSKETWAPAGAAFWDGAIFFGGLRGEALYEARLYGAAVKEIKIHFRGEFGRIRAVVMGPDGYLYLSTSNTDGRGEARAGDDKIIRIDPKVFR